MHFFIIAIFNFNTLFVTLVIPFSKMVLVYRNYNAHYKKYINECDSKARKII
jgi:hypothetical protein